MSMKISKRALLRAVILVLAIIWLISMQIPSTFEKIEYFLGQGRMPAALVYCVIVGAAWVGLFVVPFLKNTPLRILLVVFFTLGFLVNAIARLISGNDLTIQMTGTLLENAVMAPSMFTTYFWPAASWIAVALFIAVLGFTRPGYIRLPWYFSVVPLGALTTVIAVVHLTRGGATEFISPYAIPAKVFAATILKPYDGARDRVAYNSTTRPKVRHVVLVVDESVRGDYIGLNGYEADNTPYLSSRRFNMANFGVGVASWNCSKESRLILRSGLRASALPDLDQSALKKPTIWQYAEKAGFQTVLLDAWGRSDKFHSFMNKQEASIIDERIYFSETYAYNLDLALAQTLSKRLKREKPQFILVNKYGVHFPYHRSHPQDFRPFDTGPNGAPSVDGARDLLLNSYNNAVAWSVDGFFKTLLTQTDLSETALIYTSDHGQSMFENGNLLTHCGKGKVTAGEALVPMFIIGKNEALAPYRKATLDMRNKTSHFQIFPTLLDFMGYDPVWLKNNYGPRLRDEPADKRRFMTGDIFGSVRGSDWVSVD